MLVNLTFLLSHISLDIRLQAILYLIDNNADDGVFRSLTDKDTSPSKVGRHVLDLLIFYVPWKENLALGHICTLCVTQVYIYVNVE